MALPRLDEIRTLIDRADHAYYGGGQAIMADSSYDALEEELRSLCPDDPRLTRVGAPVAADSVLLKRSHSIPMGSQGKASSAGEFEAWVASLGLPVSTLFHVNYKADGGSVQLEYVNGSLFRAVTRGDGEVGEDITSNALKFNGLKTAGVVLHGQPFSGFLRVEVVLANSEWALIDPDQASNPRNMGNGIARRKDGADAEYLRAIAFRAYTSAGVEIETTESAMEASLQRMGFTTAPSAVGDAAAVWAFFEATAKVRPSLPFLIDGCVAKVDVIEDQLRLGVVSGCPKGQVALKFAAEGKETVLREIELTVGHTGAVIPTAKFDPVYVGGVTIGSALLCNWDEIRALDIAIGDTVLVERRGDVIPKIICVSSRPADRVLLAEPQSCPVCHSPLERKRTVDGDESANVFCSGDACSAKTIGKIKRWLVSLNILGIGDEVLAAAASNLGLSDAADLYTLKARADELAAMTVSGIRFGEKRAARLIEGIEATRTLPLDAFLGSLGIDALGKRRVTLIRQASAGQMDTLPAWLDGTLARIAQQAGVPNIADRIVADLQRKKPLIDKLLAAGLRVTLPEAPVMVAAGAKSVCITGALSQPKGHYEALIKNKGWIWKDSVTKGLDFLVQADPESSSSKSKKARELGIKVIGEADILTLLS